MTQNNRRDSKQLQIAEEARSIAEKDSEGRKNMRWRLRSRRLSRLRRTSLQLRLLTERNKLHTTEKTAGQRAARVVREGLRRASGS